MVVRSKEDLISQKEFLERGEAEFAGARGEDPEQGGLVQGFILLQATQTEQA
jgi:hypothetical protein